MISKGFLIAGGMTVLTLIGLAAIVREQAKQIASLEQLVELEKNRTAAASAVISRLRAEIESDKAIDDLDDDDLRFPPAEWLFQPRPKPRP